MIWTGLSVRDRSLVLGTRACSARDGCVVLGTRCVVLGTDEWVLGIGDRGARDRGRRR